MDNQYFNCERLVRLHGTNPKMGMRITQNIDSRTDAAIWFDIVRDRTNLSDGELYDMIYYGKCPMVKLEIDHPNNELEQTALEWFNNLSQQERLQQIKCRYLDWYNDKANW